LRLADPDFASFNVQFTIADLAPELFYFASNPDGRNPVVAFRADGQPAGPQDLFPQRSRPAAPGERITIAGTGFGPTFPQVQAGESPTRALPVLGKVEVFLGDHPVPPGAITFAGMRPELPPFELQGVRLPNVGIYQIDITLPPDLDDGDYTVEVVVDGVRSPSRGYLAVRRP
jgi:uncharacterized protein (TIGR03437 family)